MLHRAHTDGQLPRNYIPPCIGNGDLVLMLDDKGAQSLAIRGITEHNAWVRPRLWLSGRRYESRYRDMICYGHFEVNAVLGRHESRGRRTFWQQTLDVKAGRVETEIRCDGLIERTTTFVLLDRNLLVVHKRFEGEPVPEAVGLRYVWHLGDSDDAAPCLTDWEAGLESNDPPVLEISYRISGVQDYCGSTFLFTDQPGHCRVHGNCFEIEASPDPETHTVTFYLFFADNLAEDWEPKAEEAVASSRSLGYTGLLSKQQSDWGEFWSRMYLQLPADLENVQAVWETALYHLRIAITRWSIGPGFGNGLWAGRYFHDELFPFHALAASNHLDVAGRIPRFRRATLDMAMSRTRRKGARWGWETTEDGYEGWADLGISLYEVWHMGSFAQEAWEYYRYTGSTDVLRDVAYPIIRGCAEFYRNWVVVETGVGHAVSVPCIDIDEGLSPVTSGLCTMMAAAYSMRHAAIASETLGLDEPMRSEWLRLADIVEKSMPSDGKTYLPHQGADQVTVAVIASVFPFMIGGPSNPLAAASVRKFYRESRKSISWSPEPRHNTDWTWTSGWLAASAARLGWSEIASDAAVRGSHTAMTFGAINEHVEHHEDGIRNILPWFTTGSGAFVIGLNELFLQSWSDDIRIAQGVPESWRDFGFRLLAAPQTVVEVRVEGGTLRSLRLSCPIEGNKTQRLRIPSRLLRGGPKTIGGKAEMAQGRENAQLTVTYGDAVEIAF